MQPTSLRADRFEESVIREMTRRFVERSGDGVNLGQGFPDFAAPEAVKQAAVSAILADDNQYAVTFGTHALREAIARAMHDFYAMDVDPLTEITVCCGATEALMATLLGVLNPGDEVVIFQPFYENYGPNCVISGAIPRYVTLRGPGFHIDEDELRQAFSANTRAVIINTPHNPTGKVFSRDELTLIADLCQEFDAIAITDEIYEHIVYEGRHIPIATLPGMRDRTVTISSLSKTFSVTGWRVGWAIAPAAVTKGIRKMHDFLTVGAPAPLQAAGAAALSLPKEFYKTQLEEYRQRKDHFCATLSSIDIPFSEPQGAYYVLADVTAFGFSSPTEVANWFIDDIGVAVVPGSSFYVDEQPNQTVRFAFPKQMRTLERARELLADLPKHRRR